MLRVAIMHPGLDRPVKHSYAPMGSLRGHPCVCPETVRMWLWWIHPSRILKECYKIIETNSTGGAGAIQKNTHPTSCLELGGH